MTTPATNTKVIKLVTAVPVSGRLRQPHEGCLHLSADDAKRLLDDKAGEDVTADFTADQLKEMPVESITVVTGDNPAKLPDPHPHQSEIAIPAVEEAPKPAPKGKASQE